MADPDLPPSQKSPPESSTAIAAQRAAELSSATRSAAPAISLQYQTPPTSQRRKAPAWVWTIIIVYLLLATAFLSLPAVMAYADPGDSDAMTVLTIVLLIFVTTGLALLLTPVRIARDRPMSRRSLLIPLIASSILFAALVGGAVFAIAELVVGQHLGDAVGWTLLIGIVGLWLAWGIVFWIATRSRDPLSIAARFHRWLLLGSVAELLIAVPAHLVVRRRTECCAGIYTASAIGLGTMVMFVSFGPSVMLLYLQRARQIRCAS